jgi:hypothetical protein
MIDIGDDIQASWHGIHSSLIAWNTFKPHCMEYIQASLHKIHSSLIAWNTFKPHSKYNPLS